MRRLAPVILIAACASPAPAPPVQGRPTIVAHEGDALRPAEAPARRYNEPGEEPAPREPLLDRVVALVAEAAEASGRPVPRPDGRLYAVARDLGPWMESGGPSTAAVAFALSYHGLIEPGPHLLAVDVQPGGEESVVRELAGRLPGILAEDRFTRLGLARLPRAQGDLLVMALQPSAILTEPIPREVRAGERVALRGQALPPFSSPHVMVTGPDGKVAKVPVVREDGGRFRAEVACPSAPGRLGVEVIAEERAGDPAILANFPLYCGLAAPTSVAARSAADDEPPPTDVADAEAQVFALVQADRKAAGLAPFVWDERAAGIARAHSAEMRDKHFVGHVSPTTGAPADRARAGGIRTALVLENLATAYSPREAELALMDSPGHRANLLNPQATHIGVGIVFADEEGMTRQLYVTQLFFRVPPRVDLAAARDEARRALAAARAKNGRTAIGRDERLDPIAQRFAERLAAGNPRDEAYQHTMAELDRLDGAYGSVLSVVAVAGNATDWPSEAVQEQGVRAYGLGLAQGNDADIGEGALYVVVLLARK